VNDQPQYLVEQIADALASAEIGELDVHPRIVGGDVFLRGHVASASRRDEVGQIVTTLLPEYTLHNEVTVVETRESTEPEQIT
jgi:hypothetical protein